MVSKMCLMGKPSFIVIIRLFHLKLSPKPLNKVTQNTESPCHASWQCKLRLNDQGQSLSLDYPRVHVTFHIRTCPAVQFDVFTVLAFN